MDKNKFEETEMALLGLFIKDETALINNLDYLSVNDFQIPSNKIIFASIEDICKKGKKVDISTLVTELKRKKVFKNIGGMEYVVDICDSRGVVSNTKQYIQTLEERNKKLEIKDNVNKIEEYIKKEGDNFSSSEIISEIENTIFNITTKGIRKEPKSVNEMLPEYIKRLSSKDKFIKENIKTEHKQLDMITSGLANGELFLLGARPSMGKTAFAIDLAEKISRQKKGTVLFFSIEMQADEILRRMISNWSKIRGWKLKNNMTLSADEITRIHNAIEVAKGIDIKLDDSSRLTVQELLWKTRKVAKQGKISCIIIDYIQILKYSSKHKMNRYEEVTLISAELKAIAKEFNVPVIALSQLSRALESRENKRPIMADLRESGALEQDADIIAFLYRDYYYTADESKQYKDSDNNILQEVELNIAKNRNGMTGKINMWFHMDFGLFIERKDN